MTKKLTFKGIVQGIGFRPTAQRLALSLNLKGEVKNSGGNVFIIASGKKEALSEFVQRLISLFDIYDYTEENLKDEKTFKTFSIIHSTNDNDTPMITPDLATCEECEKELKDENNRRYMHPFISCINCGPRYTIINSLPYDRERIVMDEFPMCSECEKEYKSPSDRRCHAQTIACKDCGPEINISIKSAIETIKSGRILAIKSIGGYHLSCLANDENAVLQLRKIKGREKKPFAVMFSSIEKIKEYCEVSETEERLLKSSARPIVILKKKKDFSKAVCGEENTIGAFLPCNPIEIMITDKVSPLVMTSANISGEPIITDDEEIKKFGIEILSHNRKILTPLDDSVLKVIMNNKIQFIRRARGYVPLSIKTNISSKKDILALGGDLKSTFCFFKGNRLFLSQYFGDLEDSKCFEKYKENINRFAKLHSFKTDYIVADKHPNYYSSNIYQNDLLVQHHKAHAASVIAEHCLSGKVLSFVFDGTGFGDDKTIWGSEVFLFDGKNFERKDHLDETKMIASDEISKDAKLCLSCYIGGNELVEKAIENNINTVLSTSMGRLFDAVSALLGIKEYNSFEGECATALERVAKSAKTSYNLTVSKNPKAILTEIKTAIENGVEVSALALGFHEMLSKLILETAKGYNVSQITLSGGCFLNEILTEKAVSSLKENGYKVYINEKVPTGDGSISLGQAYIAALNLEEN